MSEENISNEFRPKNMGETRNYFIKKINLNKLMSKKHEKLCKVLKYIEHLLILISTVTGSVSISVFASLVGFPIGTTSFATESIIFVITA